MKAFTMSEVVARYPDFTLGPLSLDLEQGTVLGYIGPNGSGKSTTMHCLTGLLRTEAGRMEIFGRENGPESIEWKLDIGYVGDVHAFYERWSVAKNLKFLSQFYPDWSDALAMELVKRFNVPLDKKARDLSSGNRVKLSLVGALAHSPRLLILDEPTAGLDPVVRSEVLDTLFDVLESGERAIFYSTHILPDISRLADELAFIDDGRLVLRAQKDDLMDRWRKISFRFSGDDAAFESVAAHTREGDRHRVISSDFESTIRRLSEIGAEGIEENRMSIDEIAVHILKGINHVQNA